MKISEKLRNWCTDFEVLGEGDLDKLREMADRIDNEMVELPLDADGVPVHVGDTVYTSDGSEAYVARIDFVPDTHGVELRFPCGTISEYVPRYISHERPDSWERIADEIETYYKNHGFTSNFIPNGWADRIRKLANHG